MKKMIVGVLVVLIAALSFWTGTKYRYRSAAGLDSGNGRELLYYVDPMNPGFRSDKPGIAPCGMPLEPVYAEGGEPEVDKPTDKESATGAVKVISARQQLIGVKIRAVEKKPMTYFLRLYGRVVSDETRLHVVNSSTDCWIRSLSDVTTGSIVQKDQILGEALSPAYYNAQLTYLISLDNIDRIKQQLGGQLRHQQGDLADNQIRVAVQALQNLGITDAQTRELANTRQARPYLQVRSPCRGVVLSRKVTLNQWFKAADEFYTIADIGKVWVYADVYEDEAMHLRPGMAVEIVHRQMHKTYNAKVSEVLPLFDAVAKTLKVRVDVDNLRYDLRPDMFVDVRIPITMPSCVNVPNDAVIDSGVKTVVYVDLGNGLFEQRTVKTGWRLGRQVEIPDGLAAGEKIVVSGNFLIDSESRMRAAPSGVAADPEETAVKRDPVAGKDINAEKAGDAPDWASLLEPADGKQGISHKHNRGVASTTNATKTPGKYPTSPGVVDWNGPEKKGAPPPTWGKWGAFPGSKYLGTKNKDGDKPAFPPESGMKEPPTQTTDSDTPPEAAMSKPADQNADLNAEMDELERTLEKRSETDIPQAPAPDRPQPSATP
jgi:RND family efflux transporter MFP subunit